MKWLRMIFHFCDWRAVFRYSLKAQRWFVMDYSKCAICHQRRYPDDDHVTELYR